MDVDHSKKDIAASNLSLENEGLRVPLLTEPCLHDSASFEPSGITLKDKVRKSSR